MRGVSDTNIDSYMNVFLNDVIGENKHVKSAIHKVITS